MNPEIKYIKIALVDDHTLLRNALSTLINSFDNCKVIQEVSNGVQLMEQIRTTQPPDLVLLDLNMPVMDGYETARMLSKIYPKVHVLMLTMYDSELSLIRLLQVGVKGFLKKDVHPSELKTAIQQVVENGSYYSDHTSGKIINLFRNPENGNTILQKAILTDQEVEFLKLVCTELTYKEIAEKMGLNPRSIDSLRDQLFTKMDVKSRVGLAMVAVRHGIVTI
jgi:two-component system, NarL family, invasion response regulator UvrY